MKYSNPFLIFLYCFIICLIFIHKKWMIIISNVIGEGTMSKTRSSSKKVSLSELQKHEVSNKRQALKDLKSLNFDELQYKTTAQKRFYDTISKKDITFGIGPAGCGKTYLSVHRALRELGDKDNYIDGIVIVKPLV